MVKSQKSIEDALKKLPSVYACELDAKEAADRVNKRSDKLHHVCVTIRQVHLIIALMIWRLMERSMRTYVKNTGDLLPGWCSRSNFQAYIFHDVHGDDRYHCG